MAKWQYRIVHVDTLGQGLNPKLKIFDSEAGERTFNNPSDKLEYIKYISNYLNYLAKDGWEVAEMISDWKELIPVPLTKGFSITSPTFLLRKETAEENAQN